jgi:purine-cytosine permease-like protein
MVPFMSLSFYEGPAAVALGGADVAFVIGLAVSAVIYCLMSRNLDREAERRAIAASEAMLEGSSR